MKTKEVEEDNEKASKKVEKEEECDEYWGKLRAGTQA